MIKIEEEPIQGEDHDALQKYVEHLPSYESETMHAKSFLQKRSPFSGDNLYDHLTDLLNKILAERPENVIDFFEEYSRKIKAKRLRLVDNIEDIFVPPGRHEQVKRIMPLLKEIPTVERSTLDPADIGLADMLQNDMLQLSYYFEMCGIGLPRDDMYIINLSMRKLIHQKNISKIAFWGKIFGLQKDYIILETELKQDEYVKMNEEITKENDEEVTEAGNEADVEEALKQIEAEMEGESGPKPTKLWEQLPPEPKSTYVEPPEPPQELAGVGVNKKVFFVCNYPGEPWIQLPNVTPKQIRVARQIYHSFTGNLDHNIMTYPEFPGTEKNYLRAQLARITASTHISPLGLYSFGETGGEGEEEEEPEGGSQEDIKENLNYDPPTLKELTDPSMLFWVHHERFILPQGRTTWWDPNPLPKTAGGDADDEDEDEDEDKEEEEDEDEDEDESDKPVAPSAEPEVGPNLLTPCSEDVTIEATLPWCVRKTSTVTEEYAIAFVRSNIWPGAYCFSTQSKLVRNVYFGNGLKYVTHNYSPSALPFVEQDYPIGPEIMEIEDPTGAQEEKWRIDHLPKVPEILKAEEEPAGEEEGDDDEDDEDED